MFIGDCFAVLFLLYMSSFQIYIPKFTCMFVSVYDTKF